MRERSGVEVRIVEIMVRDVDGNLEGSSGPIESEFYLSLLSWREKNTFCMPRYL